MSTPSKRVTVSARSSYPSSTGLRMPSCPPARRTARTYLRPSATASLRTFSAFGVSRPTTAIKGRTTMEATAGLSEEGEVVLQLPVGDGGAELGPLGPLDGHPVGDHRLAH